MTDRATTLRMWLAAGIAVSLITGVVSFFIAVSRNTETTGRLTRESHVRCVHDAHQDNDRRALDLALIAADRSTLTRLRVIVPGLPDTAAGVTDKTIVDIQIAYYTAALAARLANLPAYIPLSVC